MKQNINFLVINAIKVEGLKPCNDSKLFIEYSDDMNDNFENIEEHNPNIKRKILIVFVDMIACRLSNRNLTQ